MAFLANLFGKKKKQETAEQEVEQAEAAALPETLAPSAEEPAAPVAEPQEAPEAQEEPAPDDAGEPSAEEPRAPEEQKKEKKSFWARVKAGILKTKNAIFGGIDNLLKHFVRVDEDLLEELEELLISEIFDFIV